jgi:hypothetical protein
MTAALILIAKILGAAALIVAGILLRELVRR